MRRIELRVLQQQHSEHARKQRRQERPEAFIRAVFRFARPDQPSPVQHDKIRQSKGETEKVKLRAWWAVLSRPTGQYIQ